MNWSPSFVLMVNLDARLALSLEVVAYHTGEASLLAVYHARRRDDDIGCYILLRLVEGVGESYEGCAGRNFRHSADCVGLVGLLAVHGLYDRLLIYVGEAGDEKHKFLTGCHVLTLLVVTVHSLHQNGCVGLE